MTFVMDERVKHRLTGLVVILSIAAIFIPAVLKKSNHHFEANVNLAMKLPPRPTVPKVVVPKEQALFRSIKLAEVHLPTVVDHKSTSQISKAEPLNTRTVLPMVPVMPKPAKIAKAGAVAHPAKKIIFAPSKHSPVAVKKERYAVQLASFTQQSNAKQLVSKLISHGYKASYNKFNGKQGEYYKVTVGQLSQMSDAQLLQQQLSEKLKLSGFIIKSGVS